MPTDTYGRYYNTVVYSGDTSSSSNITTSTATYPCNVTYDSSELLDKLVNEVPSKRIMGYNNFRRKMLRDLSKIDVEKLREYNAVPEASVMLEELEELKNKKESTKPSKKDVDKSTNQFIEALMSEPKFRGLGKRDMILACRPDLDIADEIKRRCGYYTLKMHYGPQNSGYYFNGLDRTAVLLLIDIVNYFPTFMELALFLKEASVYNRGRNILIKAMSHDTVKKLAEKNKWKRKGAHYEFNDKYAHAEAKSVSIVRGLSEEDIIEAASAARIKGQIQLGKLSKLEDPCILFSI